MNVHLVDGTYELFRAFYGAPTKRTAAGREVGAVRGLARSLLALLGERGVSHVAVAFDHVVESFRNDLYEGYKTGAGIEPALLAQFGLAEEATRALGIVTWSMVEFEADDALATAAARFAADSRAERIFLASPDKDLAQCVRGTRVVCLDRMRDRVLDEDGVVARYGVRPGSIPDWLALVGDTADGFPGIARWGEKSASQVLAAYGDLDAIPDEPAQWTVKVRGAQTLAANLAAGRRDARLFKRLATLREDVPLTESLDDLLWRGPVPSLVAFARAIEDNALVERAEAVARKGKSER